jgi:hypothetical protein
MKRNVVGFPFLRTVSRADRPKTLPPRMKIVVSFTLGSENKQQNGDGGATP